MLYSHCSQSLTRRDNDGNNCLHLCAQQNKTECMKLILRVQPDCAQHENARGQTPLDIARELGHELCVELVRTLACATKMRSCKIL